MAFAAWEAAVAAGATLDELIKLEQGDYPNWFLAKIIAWHNLHNAVELHKHDAAESAAKRRKQ